MIHAMSTKSRGQPVRFEIELAHVDDVADP